MSSSNDYCHKINIVNFEAEDIVTHPIVRLLGVVESNNPSSKCQKVDDSIAIIQKARNSEEKVTLKGNKFKILLELFEGKNVFFIKYCCQTLSVSLEYCPLNSNYTVMPLYVVCDGHAGYFQAPPEEDNYIESACKRILLCSKLLQCFTAEKLLENGLGRKTFCLENQCQVFKSRINFLDARKMNQEELWKNIGRDIMNSELASPNRKYLAFLSCTQYNGDKFNTTDFTSHEDITNITDAYVALGGGGLALFGTACLYTWPAYFGDIIHRFEDKTQVDKEKYLDDSCYRGTRGACFSTTLGSVLHELYHTFDLGHTENGVMGRGFDNIHKFFITEIDNASQDYGLRNYQSQIEFKEEFESDTLSERLCNENKKKDFRVIRKFEENDCTILTKSCAVILAYHRWLNSSVDTFTSSSLTYDASSKFIRSTSGIRAVEIRKQPDEMILHSWTFEGKVLKFSFRIPDEVFADKVFLTLFVEDNVGNILKKSL